MDNKKKSRQEKKFKKYLIKYMNKAYRKYTNLSIDAETQRDIFTSAACIYEACFEENIFEIEGFKDIRNMEIVKRFYSED